MTKAHKDIGASVRARLLQRAKKQGEDFQLVLTRYANERLLYRLAQSSYATSFVLKGAALFKALTCDEGTEGCRRKGEEGLSVRPPRLVRLHLRCMEKRDVAREQAVQVSSLGRLGLVLGSLFMIGMGIITTIALTPHAKGSFLYAALAVFFAATAVYGLDVFVRCLMPRQPAPRPTGVVSAVLGFVATASLLAAIFAIVIEDPWKLLGADERAVQGIALFAIGFVYFARVLGRRLLRR